MRLSRTAVFGAAMAACAVATPASAQWYVRGEVGATTGGEFNGRTQGVQTDGEINQRNDQATFDIGEWAAVAVGRTIGDRYRVELEWAHLEEDLDSYSFDPRPVELPNYSEVNLFMVNAIYQLEPVGPVRPFIGGGVGRGSSKMKMVVGYPFSGEGDGMAWQGMVGAEVAITERLSLQATMRHVTVQNADVADPNWGRAYFSNFGLRLDGDRSTNALGVGARYAF